MLKTWKKAVSLVLVFAMSMMVCVPAFAEEDASYEEASAKISSDEGQLFATLTNKVTGKKYRVKVFKEPQATNESAMSSNTYTQTYVFSIEKKYMQPYAEISTMEDSQPKYEWDDSISVQGNITLYYTKQRNSGGGGYKVLLTKVSGNWYHSDISVKMSNREVYYAAVDFGNNTQYAFKYPTSNTFSYSTGFEHPVVDANKYSACGAHMTVDLTHGSETWTFRVVDKLFNNISLPELGGR